MQQVERVRGVIHKEETLGSKSQSEQRPGAPGGLPLLSSSFLKAAVEGALIAPVADLVRMKLTSFRDKDRAHIRDLDSVGLITPEIEAGLPEQLRERLSQVRASE